MTVYNFLAWSRSIPIRFYRKKMLLHQICPSTVTDLLHDSFDEYL